jgi:demethylmenaquinone methyltransferase/2-methoxy-6-polyprenyl-1,4-benzoquinol methylase
MTRLPHKLVLATNSRHRISFFERSAPYYDLALDILTFGQYAGFLRRGVAILAPRKGEKILDLCSGTGRAASWMVTAVGDTGRVVGLDITESMVKVAKERYGGIENLVFLQRDVTQPFGYKNYFDGIFTSFAIHELPEEKRLEALTYSYQALKEEGRMVIADFNPQVAGAGKVVLLAFFKLFERENFNFFSFDQNEILKKVGFKGADTFLALAAIFQITLAHKY